LGRLLGFVTAGRGRAVLGTLDVRNEEGVT
jgi:hypothetical protein